LALFCAFKEAGHPVFSDDHRNEGGNRRLAPEDEATAFTENGSGKTDDSLVDLEASVVHTVVAFAPFHIRNAR
jgi:hypothetical protein